MIQPRREGELRYGDVCIWTSTGQEVTVLDDFDAKLVKCAFQGVIKHIPRRHLKVRATAADNLSAFDDWLEERYGDQEADQL